MYPTMAAALVPVFNLNGAQGLILRSTVLARIFSGQIRTWDHPEIQADNANFGRWNVPANQTIELVVRRDNSDLSVVFKQALAAFWPPYNAFVDPNASSTSWGNLTVTCRDGFEGVNAYLLRTPWTLSFSAYGYALDYNLSQAALIKNSGVVVQASVASITYAVLELGLSFGNNGDDPSRLTANLNNAQGVNGWPIVAYTYIILRKSQLRNGATCGSVRENVDFWQWFFTANVLQDIIQKPSLVQLPGIVRDVVLQRLLTDVTCLGAPVFQQPNATAILGTGDTGLSSVFAHLSRVYPMFAFNTSITYNPRQLSSTASVAQALSSNHFAVVRQSGLQPTAGTTTLLLAGISVVVVSQYNLTLDGATLARILEGDIRTWLHPDLLALNPAGIRDAAGNAITDGNQSILLINGPATGTAAFQDVMHRISPTFAGKALQAADYYPTEDLLRNMVAGLPFALGIATFVGDFSTRLQFASVRGPTGIAVQPSPDSIRVCATNDVYDADSNAFALSQSVGLGCYGLSEALYLIVRQPQCGASDLAEDAALKLVEWVATQGGFAAALRDAHLAPLMDVSPAVRAATSAALQSLLCIPPTAIPSTKNLLPIILGACVGGLLFIGLPVGWYVRRSNKEMRALRKQFSDVQVAQECAEAIACFNLDAVAWLAKVEHPSKIQLALLHIISLLVEVKPFIPDQVMAHLQESHTGDKDDDSNSDNGDDYGDGSPPNGKVPKPRKSTNVDALTISSASSTILPGPSSSTLELPRQTTRLSRQSTDLPRQKTRLSRQSTGLSEASSGHKAGRGSRVQPSKKGSVLSRPDRECRTCTYLCAKFDFPAHADLRTAVPHLTAAAAHIVTLAKAHGATIDRVTVDSVAVHWNVSLSTGGAPLKAAKLAMELSATTWAVRDQALGRQEVCCPLTSRLDSASSSAWGMVCATSPPSAPPGSGSSWSVGARWPWLSTWRCESSPSRWAALC
eukprot:EG_transcript_1340